jgi:protocatechuate 3,4-dioxygenase beta subunit
MRIDERGDPGRITRCAHTDQLDDLPVGRVLTRREALVLLGGAGVGGLFLLAGCGGSNGGMAMDAAGMNPSLDCTARPELTEGPYYVDEGLMRADIRADSSTGIAQEGTPLALTFNVSRIQSGACSVLAGALVDVWHCNALGVYSDVRDPGFDTVGQDWLRGSLTTDAKGAAAFTTIVPGWYQGRATHIHFKIRSAAGARSTYEFTSQLFVPEAFLTELYTDAAPYSTKGDSGRLRNADDGIHARGGSQLLLSPEASGDGYAASFNLGLHLDA